MKLVQKLRSALPLAVVATAALPFALSAAAQTHRVEKSQPVTRAVAVYEYVGDLQKPTAARLIPVSLYLGGHFEDAGTYLSQPIPLALLNGNVYELQQAGKDVGFLDLRYARNTKQNSAEAETAYDDGWFGYGKFRAPKVPKATTSVAKNDSKSTGHAYVVQDDGKPHFGSKPEDMPAGRHGRPADPDPSEDRVEKVSLPDDHDPNTPNPDRPTLKRSSTDVNGGPRQKKEKVTASVSQTPPDPSKDDDRPTLKHKDVNHTDETSDVPPDPSDLGSRKSVRGAAGTVTGAEPGLADTSRPELRRGKPVVIAAGAPDLAPVSTATGLPPDLKQAVAISDAASRPAHDFHYSFESDATRATALGSMKQLAVAVLADPKVATDATDFSKVPAAVAASPVRAGASGSRTAATPARRRASGSRAASSTRPPVPVAPSNSAELVDEQLTAYQLTFSAPPTFVYTAHTSAAGSPMRFVTVIAQQDPDGKLQPGFRSVTDAAHLDRIPRYRLVDAVDPDASNRASLLFELRNRSSRQFALYRLLGPRPDQIFETGTIR